VPQKFTAIETEILRRLDGHMHDFHPHTFGVSLADFQPIADTIQALAEAGYIERVASVHRESHSGNEWIDLVLTDCLTPKGGRALREVRPSFKP